MPSMRSSKKQLKAAKLYLILDSRVSNYDTMLEILTKAVASGVDIVQLRDKFGRARDVLKFCQAAERILKGRTPLIINDRVDLAMVAWSCGVHLGQDDIPIREARKLMGEEAIIGISCQTWEQARRAEQEGADYVGLGSVFRTETKPERDAMDLKILTKVVKDIRIPVFAIGGITQMNIPQLRKLGAKRFAVCRDVCEARDVAAKVVAIKSLLS
jgi:thiamine-phosphate pyrophosphorylase